jgi:hypothetical protein
MKVHTYTGMKLHTYTGMKLNTYAWNYKSRSDATYPGTILHAWVWNFLPGCKICLNSRPDMLQRFTFNPVSLSCEPYIYGGCGATANLFLSKEECKMACLFGETSLGMDHRHFNFFVQTRPPITESPGRGVWSVTKKNNCSLWETLPCDWEVRGHCTLHVQGVAGHPG